VSIDRPLFRRTVATKIPLYGCEPTNGIGVRSRVGETKTRTTNDDRLLLRCGDRERCRRRRIVSIELGA
jgi:hypothetical protein